MCIRDRVVVADAVHLGARASRQQAAVVAERLQAEAVAVVAVQADLAAVAVQKRKRLWDALAVGLGLVAVGAVRMAGDDEERGSDAAGCLLYTSPSPRD